MSLNTNPDSPRQKLINLMYIVLMAMLALTFRRNVLNGFSLVDEKFFPCTTANSTVQNQSLYDGLARCPTNCNPEKIGPWFEKAVRVKNMSDSLYTYVDELKLRIVKEADGKNGDVANISNKEDLEAASFVMLAPGSGQGKALFNRINQYRENILTLVTDPIQQKIIRDNLGTEVPCVRHQQPEKTAGIYL